MYSASRSPYRLSSLIIALFFIIFSPAAHAREDVAGIKPESYGFTGRLINHGPHSSKSPEDVTALDNFRWFEGGIGTRLGTAGWTSNADPYRKDVVDVFPHFTDTESHIIAASEGAGYENFTTFTEVDTTARLSVDAATVTFTALPRNEDCQRYKNYGSGKFGTSFSHSQAHQITAYGSIAGTVVLWGISNQSGVSPYAWDDGIWLYRQAASSGCFRLQDVGSGSYVDFGDTVTLTYTDPFVVTITRSGVTTTSIVYDASGTSLISAAITTGTTAYQYLYAASSYKDGAPGDWTITGTVSNLDLTADITEITYYDITRGSFPSGNSLYFTTGTTSTPITHATVRDTLFIGDVGGITAYAGNSVFPTSILVEYISGVYTDRYDWIHSGASNHVASGAAVHVGYSRPFDRFQADEDSSGMDTMPSGVTEYMKSGKMRYWLSYTTTTGGSFFQYPKIECLARELGTSWDGSSWILPAVAGVHISGASEFQDYTDNVRNASEEMAMDISQLQSGGTIYVGFPWRPRQVHLYFPETYKNDTTATLGVSYWNGTKYANAASVVDGTSSGGKTFKQSAVVDFEKITDFEKRKEGKSPYDLYFLALKVNKTISNYVKIYQIKAIPDYDSPSKVGKYTGVAAAHKRLFLYNGRDKTKVLISKENEPDCFIGTDANDEADKPFIVGRQEDFMWAGPVGENIFYLKESENFVQGGVNRNTWTLKQLRGTVPCVAPKSVAVVEFGGSIFPVYLGRSGIYGLDAQGSNPCLSADIRAYWEPGNALELPATSLKSAEGWYDPTFEEYHCLVNGKELVYSFRMKKWTVFVRSVGIQAGTFFVDKNKVRYHLLGGTGGTVYQAENGTSDYGVPIVSGVTRPPISMGNRQATRNEFRAMAVRYQLPDGTALTGNTFYLTPGEGQTTRKSTFNLADTEWKYFDLSGARPGTFGWAHQAGMEFRGRVNLDRQIIWGRERPWAR